MELPRWKINNGADFIFFDPHPGFASGNAEHEFNRMNCEDHKAATHILVERPQRNVCKVCYTFHLPSLCPAVLKSFSSEGSEST